MRPRLTPTSLTDFERFRLVACQLEHLRRLRTTRSVKVQEQLGLLPAELYKMYDMQIEDINQLERQQALKLFHFLECAMRKVKVEEAAAYVSFDGATDQDHGEEASTQFMKELGGSFVRVTRRSRAVPPGPLGLRPTTQVATFVSLAHSTVSQYLRNRSQTATSHIDIAKRCLEYLSVSVNAGERFRLIKSTLSAASQTDNMDDDILPEGGVNGRRAFDMFFEGRRICRYPCTNFLESSYPFALYAWLNWRAQLEEARLPFQDTSTICQSSQALQHNSLWYCIMMLKYWTFQKDPSTAVEYCSALLLCGKPAPWLAGLTRAARSFRKYLTDPALVGEDTSANASWRIGARLNGGLLDQSTFHASRDYNLLVGAIEILSLEDDVDCYGMSMSELEQQATDTRRWGCETTLKRFCRLLEYRLDMTGSGEYAEMDYEFLKAEFVDKIAQSRLPEGMADCLKGLFQLMDSEQKPKYWERGMNLIENSCGYPSSHAEQAAESSSGEEESQARHSDALEDEEEDDTNSGRDQAEADAVRMARQEEEQKWLEESLKRAWPQAEDSRTTSHHNEDGERTSQEGSEAKADSDDDWMSTAANKAWHGKQKRSSDLPTRPSKK